MTQIIRNLRINDYDYRVVAQKNAPSMGQGIKKIEFVRLTVLGNFILIYLPGRYSILFPVLQKQDFHQALSSRVQYKYSRQNFVF